MPLNGITFELHNSTASCDWFGETTKQGDYIILFGYNFTNEGGGCPITVNEFNKEYGTYESALKRFDRWINHLDGHGYTPLKNTCEQLTLF
jgi:predicted deacetylase